MFRSERSAPFVALAAALPLACGAAPAPAPAPAPASAPAPAPASASASAPVSPPPPLPTGGSVLVGEIVSPPHFDPQPAVESAKPDMLACYNRVRRDNPGLRGKLKLIITVNEGGAVTRVDAEANGPAYDAALVACIGDALKAVHFPKPPGLATVTAPLVFRP